MVYSIVEKKRGVLSLVILTTLIVILFAVLITYIIINMTGKGSFALGASIASTASILITPPISLYCFLLVRKVQQSRIALQAVNEELEKASSEVRILSGLLSICAKCKKIRDKKGYWKHIEAYIEENSEVLFSHGLCEHCVEELYGDKRWFQKNKN